MGGSTFATQIRSGLAMAGCLALCACGSSPITSARVETAIASTFANLVHVQVSWLGLPPVPPSELPDRVIWSPFDSRLPRFRG